MVNPKVEPWVHPTLTDMYLLELYRAEEGNVDNSILSLLESTVPSMYKLMALRIQNNITGSAFSVPGRKMARLKRTSWNILSRNAGSIHRSAMGNKPEHVLICSDSVSVLKSLRSFNSFCREILLNVLQVHTQGASVLFLWVFHVGLKGS